MHLLERVEQHPKIYFVSLKIICQHSFNEQQRVDFERFTSQRELQCIIQIISWRAVGAQFEPKSKVCAERASEAYEIMYALKILQ